MPWTVNAENLIAPNGDVFVIADPTRTYVDDDGYVFYRAAPIGAQTIARAFDEKDTTISSHEAERKEKWFSFRAEALKSVKDDSADYLKKQDAIAKDKLARPQG